MELSDGLLKIADSLGIDESFCPVRAMLGAFVSGVHFPIPDMLICSVGATCDDFSAIAQRLNGLGHPIFWWEIPHRRYPEPDEVTIELPGGFSAPKCQVEFVTSELQRIKTALSEIAGEELYDEKLLAGIKKAKRWSLDGRVDDGLRRTRNKWRARPRRVPPESVETDRSTRPSEWRSG